MMVYQQLAGAFVGTLDIGSIIAYQEFTATVTVSGTSGAQGRVVVTAPTFTADGATSYWVEFFFVARGSPGRAVRAWWNSGKLRLILAR